MSTLRWIIAVAVGAVAMAGMIWAARMNRLSEAYRRRAADHALDEREYADAAAQAEAVVRGERTYQSLRSILFKVDHWVLRMRDVELKEYCADSARFCRSKAEFEGRQKMRFS